MFDVLTCSVNHGICLVLLPLLHLLLLSDSTAGQVLGGRETNSQASHGGPVCSFIWGADCQKQLLGAVRGSVETTVRTDGLVKSWLQCARCVCVVLETQCTNDCYPK